MDYGSYLDDYDQFLGRAFKKVGSTFKKAANKVGDKVKDAAEKNKMALLLPLKGIMRSMLRKRTGQEPPKDMAQVANLFYGTFINRNNFGGLPLPLDATYADFQEDGVDSFAGAITVGIGIVNEILNFFKNLKNNPKTKNFAEKVEKSVKNVLSKKDSEAETASDEQEREFDAELAGDQDSQKQGSWVEDVGDVINPQGNKFTIPNDPVILLAFGAFLWIAFKS